MSLHARNNHKNEGAVIQKFKSRFFGFRLQPQHAATATEHIRNSLNNLDHVSPDWILGGYQPPLPWERSKRLSAVQHMRHVHGEKAGSFPDASRAVALLRLGFADYNILLIPACIFILVVGLQWKTELFHLVVCHCHLLCVHFGPFSHFFWIWVWIILTSNAVSRVSAMKPSTLRRINVWNPSFLPCLILYHGSPHLSPPVLDAWCSEG